MLFRGLVLVAVFLLGSGSGVNGSLPLEDLNFISFWTKVTVDTLKSYDSSAGSERLIVDLTSQVFKQKQLSWPVLLKIFKLRTGLNSVGDANLSPVLTKTPDQSLIIYPSWQILKTLNETSDLNATKEVLSSVASRHMTYGQAAILSDFYQSKEKGKDLPEDYLFAMPSENILRDTTTNFVPLIKDAERMFPAQRHALYKKLTGQSSTGIQSSSNIGTLVATATQGDNAELMLELINPADFKKNLADIRDKLKNLSEEEQLNAVYFPNALLNAWQEEIASNGGVLAMNANLALRGMTCSAIAALKPEAVLDVASAYNNYVLMKHPDRLKTFPISLRKCFMVKVKEYLANKAAAGGAVAQNDAALIMKQLTVSDVKKLGGLIISDFQVKELKIIEDKTVLREALASIGNIPLAELMPVIHQERLQNLTELALEETTTPTLEDLQRLGTLVFFINPDKMKTVQGGTIKTFLESSLKLPHHRCLCLPKTFLSSFSSALIRAYGTPSSWSATDLATIDELLVTLDASSIDSLSPKSLVSALPYLIQNKTYHDRHYDSFPGFVGGVSFVEACAYWLDNDENSNAFRAADDKVMRAYLLASQLAVNLALGDAGTRVRRQVSTVASFSDEQVTAVHEKTVQILGSRAESKTITKEQFDTVRKTVETLENRTRDAIKKVLNLTDINTADIQTYIRNGIASNQITPEQIGEIVDNTKKVQIAFVAAVTDILNLTSSDFNMTESDFCNFLGKPNCPPPPKSTIATTTSRSITTITITTITTSVTTTLSTTTPPPIVLQLGTWNGMVPTLDLRATEVLPSKLTCHGIIAAGPAASALRPEDLEPWTGPQLLNCIEVLGKIDWPTDVKIKAWKQILSGVNFPKNGPMMLLLRNLLEAVAIQNPDKLSFNLAESVDPLSLLADFVLPGSVVEAVAKNIIIANSLDATGTFDSRTLFHLESLKQFLCGFPVDLITKLISSATDKRGLLHCLGIIKSCHNRQILVELAKEAKSQIPQPWKPSDMVSIGIIAAGLSPTEFAALDNSSLSALTPAALKHLTPEHFMHLSAEQLTAIPPESMSILTLSQLPKDGASVLNPSQIEALSSSTNTNMPLSKLIRQYEIHVSESKPVISKSTSGSTSRSRIGLVPVFLVFILLLV